MPKDPLEIRISDNPLDAVVEFHTRAAVAASAASGKSLDQLTRENRLRMGTPGGATPEAEDGFAPGVGRVAGGAINEALTGSLKGRAVVESGSLLVPAQRDPELYGDPTKPTFLTSLIPAKPESGNDVSYLRQTLRDNQAAIVPDGETKPTSVYTLKEEKGTLGTFAHLSEYVPNRLFEDSGMLAGWLEGEMAFGLDLAVEADAVATILADPDTQAQTFATDALTSIRKGLTKLQSVYVRPDSLALSLEDAEALDLTQDTTERFYFGGPQDSGPSGGIWSVPVVINDAVPVGQAILMSARQALRRYVRMQAIFALDSWTHFDTNETRARLEQRSLVVVSRPFAVVVIDLTA